MRVDQNTAPLKSISLSFAQQRLWFLDAYNESSTQYTMPSAYWIKGDLNVSCFEQALYSLVQRHESLRTVFKTNTQDEVEQQVIDDPHAFPTPIFSYRTLEEHEVVENIKALEQHRFDLSVGPLFYCILFKLDDQRYLWFMNMHHIVSDGWSMNIIHRDFLALYLAYLNNKVLSLPILRQSYADFSMQQRAFLDSAGGRSQLDYWMKQLADAPVLNMPSDRVRPRIKTYHGAVRHFKLDASLIQGLNAIAQQHHCTLYMVLLAGFSLLLSRYSGQKELILGSPIANRHYPDVADLVGLFLNTLTLRINVDNHQRIDDFLQTIKTMVLDAYANQDIPFEHVVDSLKIERSLSHNPLFDVLFILQNKQRSFDGQHYGLELSSVALMRQSIAFDLILDIQEKPNGFEGSIHYNSDLFEEASIERYISHLQQIYDQLVSLTSSQSLRHIQLLSQAEYQQIIYDWNATVRVYPENITWVTLFLEQVQKTPEALALVFKDQTLSYRQLEQKTNELAHRIHAYYAQQDQLDSVADKLVILCLERGMDMMIALIATLRAGAAYVPCDPAYPKARVQYLMEDTKARLVLTQTETLEQHPCLEGDTRQVLCLDSFAYSNRYDAPSLNEALPHNLAYIIYTSGTTGTPKGVMIEHRSFVHFIQGMRESLADPGRTMLSTTNYVFDIFGLEYGLPLVTGGAVALANAADLVTHFNGNARFDWVQQTPSIWKKLIDELQCDLSQVTCFVGGERLDNHLYQRLRTKFKRVLHLYGPTETTIWSTMQQPYGEQALIGIPLANEQVYVLDEERQPVAIGCVGELHIAGAGVARGYLNQAEITRAHFIANPFTNAAPDRMYKTGDMVRWLACGQLEYRGRKDDQIKLRGFRIELAEIESLMNQHPNIVEAAVVVRRAHEALRLVAYYVVKKHEALAVPALTHYLQDLLPEYMVPEEFIEVQYLPLNTHGKLNKQALPYYEPQQANTTFVAPQTELERVIAQTLADVLQLERVGIHDQFFALGLDSIRVMQVRARLERLQGLQCPINAFFLYPTVASLAEHLRQDNSEPIIIPQQADDAALQLSFAQQRLYFLYQCDEKAKQYNMPNAMYIDGSIDVAAFKKAIHLLLQRHDSLRTVFHINADAKVEVVLLDEHYLVHHGVFDYAEISCDEVPLKIHELQNHCFDLGAGPLFYCKLFKLKESQHLWLMNMHHIIADAWSWDILYRDLKEFYRACVSHTAAQLPQLSIRYTDFAAWQRVYLAQDHAEAQRTYWCQQLAGVEPLVLPTDRPRPLVNRYRGAVRHYEFDEALSQQLIHFAKTQDCTLYMALLAGFSILLAQYSNQQDVVIGSPIANRHYPQVEDMVGLFINTLVMRVVIKDQSLKMLIQQLKKTVLEAFANQDLPFEQVIDALKLTRDESRNPVFDVMFLFQDKIKAMGIEQESYRLSPVMLDKISSKFDITVAMQEQGEHLAVAWQYNTDLFDEWTIDQMNTHLKSIFERMISQNIDESIQSINCVTSDEYQQLVSEWNATEINYPGDKSLVDLFVEQAKKTPDRIALIFERQALTYGALEAQSNQLARALQQDCTIEPGAFIAVLLERGIDLVIAILGILKAGAAYVPIDPNYPDARIEFILHDTQAMRIITHSTLVQQRQCLRGYHERCCFLDSFNYSDWGSTPLRSLYPSLQVAYVIYTSGTTGVPKGVLCTDKRRVNDFFWYWEQFPYRSSEVVLSKSPITTVDAIWEMFCPLLKGIPCVIVSQDNLLSLNQLIALFAQHNITRFDMTPSLMEALIRIHSDYQHPPIDSVTMITVTGEAFDPDLPLKIAAVFPQALLLNRYGSSEISSCIWQRLSKEQRSPYNLIGRPLANTKVYVVNDNRLASMGTVGELCISAAGLTSGYLNQPELTRRSITNNPYATLEERARGYDRLYKTGDLVRWNRSGALEYRGRKDFQVKIRGYRVEPAEIEELLRHYPSIEQAVVLLSSQSRQACLAAYYVVQINEHVDQSELKRYLQEKIPDYMVPLFYKELDALPLTTTGKLNRQALAALELEHAVQADYVAPRTQTEQTIAALFAEVVHLDQVGIHDSFFELGGNSILAIELIYKINQRCHRSLNVSRLFTAPTVAQLAIECDSSDRLKELRFLIPFKQIKATPLICFFPPAFGTLLKYNALIDQLNQSASLVSFDMSAHINDSLANIKTITIKDIAERYVSELLQFNARGPYILIGYCLGGKIAHYVASLLQQRGITNMQLLLLDTLLVSYSSSERFKLWIKKLHRFSALTAREQIAHIRTMGHNYRNKSRIERQITKLGRRLAKSYQAPLYVGDVVVAHSTGKELEAREPLNLLDNPFSEQAIRESMAPYVQGLVCYQLFDCSHTDLVFYPAVIDNLCAYLLQHIKPLSRFEGHL